MFRHLLLFLMLILISPVMAEEVSIQVKDLKINGTLEVPVTNSRIPLVIIIAGSGPTDRDGNTMGVSGKNNSLRQLSEKLLAHGIASFRYDKRMVGKSIVPMMIKEQDLSLEDYIQDAIDCTEYFKKDKRFSKIIIVGHSEGSLIGIEAVLRSNVDGFVSIAGIGRPLNEVINEQFGNSGAPEEIVKQCSEILDSLKAGKIVNNVNPLLYQLFRPSVQPFIISSLKYNPAAEIYRLNLPVLILQGSTDIQVTETDANLLNKAAKHPTLRIIDGMNHVMKMVPSKERNQQIKAYTDPTLEISEQLVKEIVTYISSL